MRILIDYEFVAGVTPPYSLLTLRHLGSVSQPATPTYFIPVHEARKNETRGKSKTGGDTSFETKKRYQFFFLYAT
jgi:hypothetical protein